MRRSRLARGGLLFVALLALASGCGDDQEANPGGQPAGPECTVDADCDGGGFCIEGACVQCRTTDDCTDTVCVEGACVGCTDDAQCPDERCEINSGRCVGCLSNQDCERPTLCDVAKLECVQCLTTADCRDGGVCEDGTCARACRRNSDCEGGFRCIGAPDGTCLQVCDPETGLLSDGSGAACPEGEGCQFTQTFNPQNQPVGVCVARNGGGGPGAPCGTGQACEVDLVCVGTGAAARCFDTCDPDDATNECEVGRLCAPVPEDATDPGSPTIGLCTNGPCSSDADCGPTMVCTAIVNTAATPDAIETVCAYRQGPSDAGEACVTNADCAGGICLASLGVCYGSCASNEGCSDGSACINANFGLPDGSSSTAPACFPLCDSDADCGAGNGCFLSSQRADDGFVTICSGTDGTLNGGAPCTNSTQCRSNFCNTPLEGGTGYCEGFCNEDADCGGTLGCAEEFFNQESGPDGIFGTPDDVFQAFGRCRGAACASDSDCVAGWTCRLGDERVGEEYRAQPRCHPRQGDAVGGAICRFDASLCASGACITPPWSPPEDCDDTVDNDGDGSTDCDDADCFNTCGRETFCEDGLDNDNDTFADCADFDCTFVCTTEQRCDDTVDNDDDGFIDCQDPDCAGRNECREICDNGIDDNENGDVDCDDDDCDFDGACESFFNCTDGTDNDRDGRIDCDDPGCCEQNWICARGVDACAELNCGDTLDDDGDGLIDCQDVECANDAACRETACDNGVDDDGDGDTDCADVNCFGATGCRETECDDDLDNEADGLRDCFDPDCATSASCSEFNCGAGNCCRDGLDNDGDGRTDCQDDTCEDLGVCTETACGGPDCCRDGLDTDDDGLSDCFDLDCRFDTSCRESNCIDGADNDTDGEVDCRDDDCRDDFNCRVCFQACQTDIDCGEGLVCYIDGGSITLPPFRGDFGYWGSCGPPPPSGL